MYIIYQITFVSSTGKYLILGLVEQNFCSTLDLFFSQTTLPTRTRGTMGATPTKLLFVWPASSALLPPVLLRHPKKTKMSKKWRWSSIKGLLFTWWSYVLTAYSCKREEQIPQKAGMCKIFVLRTFARCRKTVKQREKTTEKTLEKNAKKTAKKAEKKHWTTTTTAKKHQGVTTWSKNRALKNVSRKTYNETQKIFFLATSYTCRVINLDTLTGNNQSVIQELLHKDYKNRCSLTYRESKRTKKLKVFGRVGIDGSWRDQNLFLLRPIMRFLWIYWLINQYSRMNGGVGTGCSMFFCNNGGAGKCKLCAFFENYWEYFTP